MEASFQVIRTEIFLVLIFSKNIKQNSFILSDSSLSYLLKNVFNRTPQVTCISKALVPILKKKKIVFNASINSISGSFLHLKMAAIGLLTVRSFKMKISLSDFVLLRFVLKAWIVKGDVTKFELFREEQI